MARNRKSTQRQAPVSPKKYIVTKGRTLPVHNCLINTNWKESGIALIYIARLHKNGRITAATYLVDLLAKGVKDTSFYFSYREEELMDLLDGFINAGATEADYPLVHNIIYAALDFAEEHGFKPHPDFAITEYMLEEDTDEIEYIDIECGRDGKLVVVESLMTHADEEVDREDQPYDEDDEDEVPDIHQFSDEEWKEYLAREPNADHIEDIIDCLIFRYAHEVKGKAYIRLPVIKIDSDPKTWPEEEWERLKSISTQLIEAEWSGLQPTLLMEIDKGISRYPSNPAFLHFRCTYMKIAELEKEHEAELTQLCNRFPDYLFGIAMKGLHLLSKGDLPAFEKFIGHKFELEQLFPGATRYHFNDVIEIERMLAVYWMLKDDELQAKRHLDRLQFAAASSDDVDEDDNNVVMINQYIFEKIRGWMIRRKV